MHCTKPPPLPVRIALVFSHFGVSGVKKSPGARQTTKDPRWGSCREVVYRSAKPVYVRRLTIRMDRNYFRDPHPSMLSWKMEMNVWRLRRAADQRF